MAHWKRWLALALALVLCLALFAGCSKTQPASAGKSGEESDDSTDREQQEDDGLSVSKLSGRTPVEKLTYGLSAMPEQMGEYLAGAAAACGGEQNAAAEGGTSVVSLTLQGDRMEPDRAQVNLRTVYDPDTGSASMEYDFDVDGTAMTLGLYVENRMLYIDLRANGESECVRIDLSGLEDLSPEDLGLDEDSLYEMLGEMFGVDAVRVRQAAEAIDLDRVCAQLQELAEQTLEQNTTEGKGTFQLPGGTVETTRVTMELGEQELADFLIGLREILYPVYVDLMLAMEGMKELPSVETPEAGNAPAAGYYIWSGYTVLYSDGQYLYEYIKPGILGVDQLSGWQYCSRFTGQDALESSTGAPSGVPEFRGVGSGVEEDIRGQIERLMKNASLTFSTDLYGDVPVACALDILGGSEFTLNVSLYLWEKDGESVFGLDFFACADDEPVRFSLENMLAPGSSCDYEYTTRCIAELDGDSLTLDGTAGINSKNSELEMDCSFKVQSTFGVSGSASMQLDSMTRGDGSAEMTYQGSFEASDGRESVGFELGMETSFDPAQTTVARSSWRPGDASYTAGELLEMFLNGGVLDEVTDIR